MDEKKFIKICEDVTATRTDIKWIKDKITSQNGVLTGHMEDSEKRIRAIDRNTTWRHAFKVAIGGAYLVLLYIFILMLNGGKI